MNMRWSVTGTVGDCISNAAGWLLALGLSGEALPRFGRGISLRLGAILR